MKVWSDAGIYINHYQPNEPTTICVGSEWYQFPSHFFLPQNTTIEYVDDGFKGILPQHYSSLDGTKVEPLQPFNNMNREEPSRYVDFSHCHYYIGTRPPQYMESLQLSGQPKETCSLSLQQVYKQPIVTGAVGAAWALGKAYVLPFQPEGTLLFQNYTFYKVNLATDLHCSVPL
jgi:hypothetical protein